MSLQSLAVFGVQSTLLLLGAIVACRLLKRSPAARLIVCRAAILASLAILFAPKLPERTHPSLALQIPVLRPEPVSQRVPVQHPAAPPNEAAPPVAPPSAAPIDTLVALEAIWFAGVASLLGTLGFGYLRLNRLNKNGAPVVDGPIATAVRKAATDYGVTAPPIRSCRGLLSPFVAGVWRPTLYVPSAWTKGEEPESLEAICRHEVAHLAARDLWWQLFYRLAQTVLWPQPLMWLVPRIATAASEELCDRRVLESGCSAREYAASLLSLKEAGRGPVRVGIGAVSIRSNFGKRIEDIMASTYTATKELSRAKKTVLLAGCALCAGLAATMVGAESRTASHDPGAKLEKLPGWYAVTGLSGPTDVHISDAASFRVAEFSFGKDLANGAAAVAVSDSTSKEFYDYGIAQVIRADAFRGKRVQLRGLLKAKDLTGGAGLWMDVRGEAATLASDNMLERELTSDSDWSPYTLVLEVPKNATTISFGDWLGSSGKLWVKGLSLTAVDPATTPITGLPPRKALLSYFKQPENLDFAATGSGPAEIPYWISLGGGWKIDPKTGYQGKPSVTAAAATEMVQRVLADSYRGKRIKFQARMKGFGIGQAFISIMGGAKVTRMQFLSSQLDPSGWEPVAAVVDVPTWATGLMIGVQTTGEGRLWVSDCSLQIVDPANEQLTYEPLPHVGDDELSRLPSQPVNLNFEK